MADPLKYTSSLLGEQIDAALLLALSIAQNKGIPVGQGDGTIRLMQVVNALTNDSDAIPSAKAVLEKINKNIAIASAVKLVGVVQTFDDLPRSANVGDSYLVVADQKVYVWDGSVFMDAGSIVSTIRSVCKIEPNAFGDIDLQASDLPLNDTYNVGTALNMLLGNALLKGGGNISGTITGVEMSNEPSCAVNRAHTDSLIRSRTNITVMPTAFIADSTHSAFPFSATIQIDGVTEKYFPHVEFSDSEDASGKFYHKSESVSNGVKIYASEPPSRPVIIPSIVCWRASV